MPGCAKCGKEATASCSGCKDSPDAALKETIKTYYCSKDCQKSHWIEHKAVCKIGAARKTLVFRAETLQQAFYMHRKATCDRPIIDVQRGPQKLLVIQNEAPKPPTMRQNGDLPMIPESLWSGLSTRELAAVLSMDYSNSASSKFMGTLGDMLQDGEFKSHCLTYFPQQNADCRPENGFTVVIARLTIRQPPLRTSLRLPHLKEGAAVTSHTVFELTWKLDSTVYVLDLAGAQFGWHEAVVPWSEYRAKRVATVEEIKWPQTTGELTKLLISRGSTPDEIAPIRFEAQVNDLVQKATKSQDRSFPGEDEAHRSHGPGPARCDTARLLE